MLRTGFARVLVRLLAASVVAVALVACGAPVGGTWSGTLVQAFPVNSVSYSVTVNITVGESASLLGYTIWSLSGDYTMDGGVGSGSLTGVYGEGGGEKYISLTLSTSGDAFYLEGTLNGNQITGEWDRGSTGGTFSLNR